MVRFYKAFVDRIVVALILLMQTEKASGKETIVNILKGHKATDPVEEDIVYRAISRYYDTRPSDEDYIANEEVLGAAFAQLRKTKQDDTDLIETIVKALQLPHSAHYFNMAHLKQLRDAILRPTELAKWKKTVLEGNLKCRCGHSFETGEAIITRAAGDGTYEFMCHKCTRPQRVACDRCGETFILNEKINYMAKVECGCHLKKKAPTLGEALAGTQAPAPPPPMPGRTRAQRMHIQDEIFGRLYQPNEMMGAMGWAATPIVAPDEGDGGL